VSANVQVWALNLAAPRYRLHLADLYARWHAWNLILFDGQLRAPLLIVGVSTYVRNCTQVGGLTSESATWPGTTLIALHGSLFTLPAWTRGRPAYWRDYYVAERAGTLLHEMVHQAEKELVQLLDLDRHGEVFVMTATKIAGRLGLDPPGDPKKWPFGPRDRNEVVRSVLLAEGAVLQPRLLA
jgi:hypothetical protein